MTDDDQNNVVDLEAVRRGDRLLDQAAKADDVRSINPDELETIMDKATYSVAEAADLTGYSGETIRRHIRNDNLKAAGGGPGRGTYRISKVELERWWKDRGGGDLFEGQEQTVDLGDLAHLESGGWKGQLRKVVYFLDRLLEDYPNTVGELTPTDLEDIQDTVEKCGYILQDHADDTGDLKEMNDEK